MIRINNIPGLGTREFPEGTSTDDIKRLIDKERNFGAEEPGFPQSALIAGGQGLTRAGQGLEGLGRSIGEGLGVLPSGSSDNYARGIKQERQDYERGLQTGQQPLASTPAGVISSVVGQALPFLGMAGAGIPASIGAGAVQGLTAPVEPGQSRAVQTAAGAGFGLGGNLLGRGIGAGFGRLMNGVRGEALDPAQQELINLSQQHDIPIHANQFDNTPSLDNAAAYLRRGPFGLVEKEIQQGQKIGESAANFSNNMMDELNAGQYGGARGIDALKAAAEGKFGQARQGRASQLLDRINQDVGWTTIIDTSKDVTKLRRQIIADKMADKMTSLAGDDAVPLTNFKSALKEVDEKIGSQLKPDDPLKAVIDDLKEKVFPDSAQRSASISGATKETPLVDPATGTYLTKPKKMFEQTTGAPIQSNEVEQLMGTRNTVPASRSSRKFDPVTGKEIINEPEFKFGSARELRTYLQQKVRDGLVGTNAIIGDNENRLLQQLVSATDKDLNTFAESKGGELLTQMRKFNNFYRTNLGPYKNRELAAALNKINKDDIYKAFIQSGNFEGDPKQLYNFLDEKGRSAVRAGMVDDAYQKAFNADSEGFSAPKFLNALNAKKGARNVFFQGQSQKELDGFTKLLDKVKGSSSAGGIPVTGAMNVPIGATAAIGGAGAAIGGPMGAVSALGAAFAGGNGVRWMLTDPRGRNILLSASKLDPNSKAMDALLVRAGNLFQTALTQQGGERASK